MPAAGLGDVDVVRAFKGPEVPQIAVVHDNSSCDLPFATGEEWLGTA